MIYHFKYVHCRLTIWEYCYARQMWVLAIFYEYVTCSPNSHVFTRDAYWIPLLSNIYFWILVMSKWISKMVQLSLDFRWKQVLHVWISLCNYSQTLSSNKSYFRSVCEAASTTLVVNKWFVPPHVKCANWYHLAPSPELIR